MILTEKGVLKLMQRIKSFIASQLNTKASSVHTHSISEIDNLASQLGGGGYSKSEVDTLLNGKADTSHTHIKSDITDFPTIPSKTSDLTNDSGFLTSHQDLSGYVPRSGGAVLTGVGLYRVDNTGSLHIGGGVFYDQGGAIVLRGNSYSPSHDQGMVRLLCNSTLQSKYMDLYPNGTWTWEGQAVQLVSDQRLKQQISKIDNALLDAWEDVDLVQFKYNDAVNEKGSNARLHTGYVVQQIDAACKSHNVDISDYGLYCHEEYPEETEEVEVEQDDGTKTKETKVIREASEHYSLRYTEVYAVECAYLRREINKLKEELKQLKTK